jgi:hypothetical protein
MMIDYRLLDRSRPKGHCYPWAVGHILGWDSSYLRDPVR